ncbi:MAG: hypothetical protein M1836_006422 [Candelina mexicana]|nr:MAG: hypothetical protein M1836_006422 [Candelina mexicana]
MSSPAAREKCIPTITVHCKSGHVHDHVCTVGREEFFGTLSHDSYFSWPSIIEYVKGQVAKPIPDAHTVRRTLYYDQSTFLGIVPVSATIHKVLTEKVCENGDATAAYTLSVVMYCPHCAFEEEHVFVVGERVVPKTWEETCQEFLKVITATKRAEEEEKADGEWEDVNEGDVHGEDVGEGDAGEEDERWEIVHEEDAYYGEDVHEEDVSGAETD